MAEYINRERARFEAKRYFKNMDEIQEDLDMLFCMLPAENVAPVQEWISVKEHLPQEKVDCIVHYKHAYCDNDDYWAIGICFYDGEKFQFNSAYKVTHWMPLPQLPKGTERVLTDER